MSCTALAAGGVVGNVVDAGENIVNDVVDAGENVIDNVTDAVTGDNGANGGTTNGTNGGATNGTTNGTTNGGTTNGTNGGTTNGANSGNKPSARPDEDVTINDVPTNPNTGIPFAYAAIAAFAVGGTGVALTLRRDD